MGIKIPGQVGLGCVRSVPEQVRGSELVRCALPCFLPVVLLEFLPLLPAVTDCYLEEHD